jgi:hypothetical protein
VHRTQCCRSDCSFFSAPGKRLTQHDFLYPGEGHDRKIFIVRQGKIVLEL